MRNPIEFQCFFCGAAIGTPCLSVGNRPVVEPHMQRLKLATEHARGDATTDARDAYARSAVTLIFGRCDEELLARARKDRSIDTRKPWVRRLLDPEPTKNAESGDLFGGPA